MPFVSCKKNEIQNNSSSIIGEWIWVSTCGGITGACETPKSTNKRINLVFTANSICFEYQNDTLTSSRRFYIYKLVDPNDSKDITFLLDGDQIFSVSNNSLYLIITESDFGSYYKRARY